MKEILMSKTLTPQAGEKGDRSILKRAVTGAMAGTVMEWYEFFIYGTAAALVFSKTFFRPPTTHWMQSSPHS